MQIQFSQEELSALAASLPRVDPPPKPSINYADLANGSDCSAALSRALVADRIVTLPRGVYTLDASTLVIPPGCVLRGESSDQTIVRCVNPPASHLFVKMQSGSACGSLFFNGVGSPPGGTGSLVWAGMADDIVLDDVRIEGAGEIASNVFGGQHCLSLWACRRLRSRRLRIAASVGACYGTEIIGGSDLSFVDGRWSLNSADGVKIMGNSDFGVPRYCRFVSCVSELNGQCVSNPVGTVLTKQESIGSGRYVLAFSASAPSFKLPDPKSVPDGTCCIFYRRPTTPVVVIDCGSLLVSTISSKLAYRFTVVKGTWVADNWSNGEGWDISGIGYSLVGCNADGNHGGGFQVKPGAIQNSDTSDISFAACNAMNDTNGNGFAVVNNSAGLYVPSNISYSDCGSWDNSEAGWAFTTQEIRGVGLANCRSRSNGGPGIVIQAWTRDLMVQGLRLAGNGKAAPGAGYNWLQRGGKRISAYGLHLSGVDPISQQLRGSAIDDPANTVCQGMYLLRATSEGETAEKVQIAAMMHNHSRGVDCDIYRSPGQKGTSVDFPGVTWV